MAIPNSLDLYFFASKFSQEGNAIRRSPKNLLICLDDIETYLSVEIYLGKGSTGKSGNSMEVSKGYMKEKSSVLASLFSTFLETSKGS